MTDTLTNAPAPAPPTPTPEPNPGGLSSDLTATVTATPELSNDPASAVAVAASGGNVVAKGNSVAHAVNQTAKVQAVKNVQQSGGGGLFGDLEKVGSDLASTVGNIVNKPLQLVQHEYRYLHDVEARHGMGAAFTEGLGLAAGAVVGGVVGTLAGGNTIEGATLGAEGAGYLEGQVQYKDSWARTTNGATYRDPHSGQLVSFGRDLANVTGVGAKTGGGKVLSGVLDGLADLTADPVSVVGKVYAGQKTLGLTADNVDRAWHNPLTGFKRATEDMAASDAGTIASHYPQFKDVAGEIAARNTPEGVRDFFKSLANANEVMDAGKLPSTADAADGMSARPLTTTGSILPSLSPFHVPFRALRDVARDSGHDTSFFSRYVMNNPVLGPGRWMARLEAQPGNSLDRATKDLTGFQYDPGSNIGNDDVRLFARYSMGETASRAISTALYNATESQRVTIFRNTFFKTLFHMARMGDQVDDLHLAIDNPAMEKSMLEMVDGKTQDALLQRMESHMEQIPHEGSQPGRQYYTKWNGDPGAPYVDKEGVSSQGAVTPNQTGALSIPNITEARRMAQAIRQGKTSSFLGSVDDFFYDHVTQGFFKPLVLMSGGYALHIALAELIPNTLRHGLRSSISAIKTRAFSDLGWAQAKADTTREAYEAAIQGGVSGAKLAELQKLAEKNENDGLTGWLYRTLGGSGIQDKNDVKYMIQSREANGGDITPTGLAAGEANQGDIQPLARAQGGMRQIMGAGYRQGKAFYAIDDSDPRFVDALHAELAENVNRWTIPAAQAYKDALNGREEISHTETIRPTAADIPDAEFYHGSPKKFEGGRPYEYGGRSAQNLFGTGFYTTDSKDIALSYTGKGARRVGQTDRTVYGMRWRGSDKGPNLLDLERPLPDNVAEMLRTYLGRLEHRSSTEELEIEPTLAQLDAGASGRDVLMQLRRSLGDVPELHMEDADEVYDDMAENLKDMGYDGWQHIGGQNAGRGRVAPHQVRIFFDPGKLAIEHETSAEQVEHKVIDQAGHAPMGWKDASEVARQTTARVLRAEQERGGNMLARSENQMAGAPPSWDGIDGHAQALVDKLMGAVHARPTEFDDEGNALAPGPVNQDLLDSIANGRIPTRDEVHALTTAQRPLNVKARELVPLHSGGAVQAIANFGFKKFLNPIVNVISRNQEYTIEYLKQRRAFQPLVDKGIMSEDEALTEAQVRATAHGLRFVHNLHDRTQWTATLRNWAPFFFAQEQAYRRMGRLLAEDPGAFRRYQLMISGVHNLAQTLQDSTGNQYIAFPGSGFIGMGVANVMGEGGLTLGGVSPMSLGGSFTSANVIFPLSQGVKPDLGPLAIIPAAQLSAMFTELNKTYAGHNSALGVVANDLADVAGSEAMNENLWEQIIPNATAQRVLQAAMGDDRAFNSSVMQSYQWAMYQQAQATKTWIAGGRKGPEPEIVPGPNATAMQKQQFQDKIRNYTRMAFFVRALAGFVSPVSASVVVQNLGIPGRLQNYIQSNGSVALGMQAAHLDHPDWDPWLVSESFVPSSVNEEQSSGYSLSASLPAQQWVTDNQSLMDKYGPAALWLMPQLTDAKYDPTIYNEQIAQGLRIKDTPDQFLAALYTNAGNNLYYSALPIHEQALAAAGKNTTAVNAEYDNWNNYVTKLEQQNPVWAENFLSADKQVNRVDAIKQLHAMFSSGDAPAGPMTDDVQFLLQQYDSAAADYQNAGQARTYSEQLSQQKAVSDNWINYVTGLETSMPQLKPVINGVFKEALVVKT